MGWTEALRDTVSAHAGLEQAIPATATNAAPAIRDALLRLAGQLRTRVPLQEALLDLAEQLDHSADMIIAALINNVQRRGDGLVKVLTGLAVAGTRGAGPAPHDHRQPRGGPPRDAADAADRARGRDVPGAVLQQLHRPVPHGERPARAHGRARPVRVLVRVDPVAGRQQAARPVPADGRAAGSIRSNVRIVAGLTGGDAAPHQTGESTAAAGEWRWS